MSVHRKGDFWLLFNDSATGMPVRNYDVVIPDELSAGELAKFLDDMFHEYATNDNPSVKTIK